MAVKNLKILIRGGGELASAMACRMAESHFDVIMTEGWRSRKPCGATYHSAEAVYEGTKTVEGRYRQAGVSRLPRPKKPGRPGKNWRSW